MNKNSQLVILNKATQFYGWWYGKGRKRIEFLWFKKNNERKDKKLLIFLHGHNSSATKSFWCGLFGLRSGCDVLLISLPGYGNSDGPADYCGPRSIERLSSFIETFLKRHRYKKKFIWGISRGAISAGLLASKAPSFFDGVILEAGAYDFGQFYKTTQDPILKRNIRKEAGTTSSSFKLRSSLETLDRYAGPLLILHGNGDSTIPAEQAHLLYERRKYSGLPVTMKIYSGVPHHIPFSKIELIIKKFLSR